MGSVFLMQASSLAILAEFYVVIESDPQESDSATVPIVGMGPVW
jgi:hypothetical protein